MPRLSSSGILALPLVLVALCGFCHCAVCAPPPAMPPCGIIYVANGAGDFRCTSKAFEQAVQTNCLPLRVETVFWSHGYARVFADQLDQDNVKAQGRRLACELVEQRQKCPNCPLFLIGHCAGCPVVLAAAEAVPPCTIDRIVLLAPSVHHCYDLRAALSGTRAGIDTFNSEKDNICLGWGMRLMGLCGGKCCPPAGRVGFQPVVATPEDAACYAKLRQYPWCPGMECTGHKGGHYGVYQQDFLRSFVLPLLVPSGQAGGCGAP